MNIVAQLRCGKYGGVLEIAEGVCMHTDPEQWALLLAEVSGVYAGTAGDAEWPVHIWVEGEKWASDPIPNSAALIKARAARFVTERDESPAEVLPPLVCFPLRVEWEQQKPRERSQHPEPEVRGEWHEDVTEMLVPDPALKIAELAREAGWKVRMSYARGNGVHGATGKPTAVRHSIAVAFGRHPMTAVQAVATYVRPASGSSWSWESVWVLGPSQPHFGLLSLAELKAFLETQVLDEAAVRERVRAETEAKSEQDAARTLLKELRQAGMSVAEICTAFGLELEVEDVIKIVSPPKKREAVAGR